MPLIALRDETLQGAASELLAPPMGRCLRRGPRSDGSPRAGTGHLWALAASLRAGPICVLWQGRAVPAPVARRAQEGMKSHTGGCRDWTVGHAGVL